MMSQIGLQMWTVRNRVTTPEDYRTTLRRIAEIGYRVIQVTPPSFFTDEEFMGMLRDYGLCPDSVFLPTGSICARIAEAEVQARRFGVDVLRTDSIPKELRTSAEGYHDFARRLNEEGAACKQAGLKLMYHFHAFEWIRFGAQRGIDILLNETDPELVYFQPDVFWLTCAGTEPSQSLKLFRNRAFSIHVKDYAIQQLEGKIESVPFHFASVGCGNLNWPGILDTAREMGIRRFVVEQDQCVGDEFDAIKVSYDALRAMGLE